MCDLSHQVIHTVLNLIDRVGSEPATYLSGLAPLTRSPTPSRRPALPVGVAAPTLVTALG